MIVETRCHDLAEWRARNALLEEYRRLTRKQCCQAARMDFPCLCGSDASVKAGASPPSGLHPDACEGSSVGRAVVAGGSSPSPHAAQPGSSAEEQGPLKLPVEGSNPSPATGLSRVCERPDCPACKSLPDTNGLLKNYFDREPSDAITVKQVRFMRGPDPNKPPLDGWHAFYRAVLAALTTHPGVSSSARAVIEAALR